MFEPLVVDAKVIVLSVKVPLALASESLGVIVGALTGNSPSVNALVAVDVKPA